MITRKIIVISIFLMMLLTGCSSPSKGQSTNTYPVLYQDKTVGLTLYQTGSWERITEKNSPKSLNVTFKENKIQAIVSVVSNQNTVKSIQDDLLKSVIQPKIISQTDSSLVFESGTQDKIRVTCFLKKNGAHNYIFSFITPASSYNNQSKDIKIFMDQVKIK
jgi:hypothetical protein